MNYNKKLISIAKKLRKEMTQQEKHLWYDFLRHYPIKIYKQKVIDNFIVDFYCYKAKLVIEVDGSQHYTEDGIEYDKARTKVLNSYNLEVVRFSNYEVENRFEEVCESIDEIIKSKVKDSPSQSLRDSSPKGRA
ncbi:endonuclease domain-containing protein [Haliovirga abyssi]|uniref:Endonuclease n=1 Tax=Haliovirga abyssi TaxID=2996794 RepID=A0AAU9DGX4_9FUSO|nr:endonuclease domain-containing protein [Haliovirga abyssi]BDU50722.1 endonuclease [Haliovirga abyssi]